ncbi:MAG TPA: 3-hydroxyisobutyrate dehydrogenase, partial [Dehalococcoidia bacterium]|nr:3-hydroxyisobutyrate dehydrogenase [Dehalococcoidia bacterium]
RSGSIVIDMSSIAPLVSQKIAAECAKQSVDMLDAPVSGGPEGARTRKLAVWVGGDEEIFERCKPALDAIGDKPYYVGPIGAGTVAKLAHNCIGYIIQTGMAEVFTMGVKAGVDPLALWLAVRQGAHGRRGVFERLPDHFLIGEYDPPDFALRGARKDIDLAVQVGREFDVPMRLASISLQEMIEGLNRGWGDRDSRSPMMLQEERAGVQVRTTKEAIQEALE